jgi:endonuclease I
LFPKHAFMLYSALNKQMIYILGFILFFIQTGFTQPPQGYYNSAIGLSGIELQMALHNIIKNHTVVSYTPGVWNAFYTTDDKPDSTVWDMYSDIPDGTPNGNPPYVYQFGIDQCGTANSEGDCYSREHSFPKSWFNELAPMYTDLFQIIPTDQYVNNKRSNYPYGEVDIATWTSMNGSKVGPCITPGYSGTVFEPRDEYKGDLARIYFYMSVRYYTEDSTWIGSPMVTGSQLNPWALAMMLDWDQQDSVSQKEIDRNNAVYAIQNNRNPFIDHSEYVNAIWGTGYVIKPEPTNHVTGFTAVTGYPSSGTIILTWIDAIGITIPDGYLIKGSTMGYQSITDPVDGTPVPDEGLNKNVLPGVQLWSFTGLNPDTTYYFKIYPYTNTNSAINYKTDGTIPVANATTTTGYGTIDNPLTCVQAIANNSGDNLWVHGYIVGTIVSENNVKLTPPFTITTNFAMADNFTETNLGNILYIQLPAGVIRNNLNLAANSSNYHKHVVGSGDLKPYFGTHPGMKNTDDYRWYEATSSIQSGNWSTSVSWNTGIPYQHDDVTVDDTIHVNIPALCNILTISQGGFLVIETGKVLQANGTFILTEP